MPHKNPAWMVLLCVGVTGCPDGAHPPNGYAEIPGERGPLGPNGAGKVRNCDTLGPLLDYVEDMQEVLEG